MSDKVDLLEFHWRYFLTLDADVEATLRYVELDKSNFDTFSIEYVRLLFGICSEFEVICKNLCHSISPDQDFSKSNITKFSEVIQGKFLEIGTLEISVPKLGENPIIKPLEGWSKVNENDSLVLSWWRDYNKVKHERQNNFERANLRNVVYSLAGLFGVLLYLARSESDDGRLGLYPPPNLLYYPTGFRSLLATPGTPCILPDFPDEITQDNCT